MIQYKIIDTKDMVFTYNPVNFIVVCFHKGVSAVNYNVCFFINFKHRSENLSPY
jgi:hypothetical protein